MIASTRFEWGIVKSWCYLGGVGFLSEGDEGIEAQNKAHKPLPPLDGRIK